MKKQFALLALCLLIFQFSVQSQDSPKKDEKIQFKPDLEDTPKGVFFAGINLGSSFTEINSGLEIVNSADPSENKNVKVGPASGLGFEIGIGGRIKEHTRLVVIGGYQKANGNYRTPDSKAEFSKLFVRPEVWFSFPASTWMGFELGLGGYLGIGNNLKIVSPSVGSMYNRTSEINVRYKTNVGGVGHFYLTAGGKKGQFYTGIRLTWVDLKVDYMKYGDIQMPLSEEQNENYNNKNGGGLSLVGGFRLFF